MSDEGEGLRASSSSPSPPASPTPAGQTHLPQPPRPLKRRASAPLPLTYTRARDASPRDLLDLIGRSPARLGRCCALSPARDGLQNRGQLRRSPHRPDDERLSPEELIETPQSCAPPYT
ncbi:hypothetical protein QQF64_006849 [Cirrhinus molitorella]